MFGRSGIPAFRDATFRNEGTATDQVMTLQGTVNKTGILLALVVVGAAYTWNLFFQTGDAAGSCP